METKKRTYGRFFAAMKRVPTSGDRDETMRGFIRQYTWGRTDRLHEMTQAEYDLLCEDLERLTGIESERRYAREQIRRKRSNVLHLMQTMGVDTSDWERVNALCLDSRMAGKRFGMLSADELDALDRKLYAILSRGGFKRRKETRPDGTTVLVWTADTTVLN